MAPVDSFGCRISSFRRREALLMQRFACSAGQLQHLPPHLREICTILAAGLVRLRSRTAEDFARDAEAEGESSLHFTARQSVCVTPKTRRSA
jgi:hypothetical protein